MAVLPTPLVPARELRDTLGGPNLLIKRDDLISFGFGGNKVRGLEFLLADALEQGADTLVTGAGPQSNHVRATAAAASYAGLDMIAIYWGERPEKAEGNLLLTQLLGAKLRFTEDYKRSSVDRKIETVATELRAAGKRPYAIPRAGACARGVLGHVVAMQELAKQCQADGIAPDVVVLAVGSGATLAGWLLGSAMCGARWRIEGYTVSRPAVEVRRNVVALASEAAELIGFDARIVENDVVVHDGFIGEGYGVPTPEGRETIRMAARCQGIFLDPVYTGKALAGYWEHVQQGRFRDVETAVFIHTGGEPTLFIGKNPWP